MRFLFDDSREHGPTIALDAVTVLHGGAPVELRALPIEKTRGVRHGIFADHERLGGELARLIDDDTWSGLYVTLHELTPHVTATDTLRGGAGAIAAADIARFRWFYIDIDRADELRRLGNATDAERAACLDVAVSIADDLAKLVAPGESIGIVQGANGAAVLLRIDLPSPGGRKLLDGALRGLADRHRRDGVMIDLQPNGPTAHLRLPGTVARKYPPTPGRPWSAAWLLRAPDRECVAPVAVLERLAAHDPRRPARRQPRSTKHRTSNAQPANGVTLNALRDDAMRWGIRREHTSGGAVVLELEHCPYQDAQGGAHRSAGKAFVNWFPSGRWEPSCHSPKCAGLSWRWLTGVAGHPK